MTHDTTRCHLCNAPLTTIDAFKLLDRVTSDCRPWPPGGGLAVCADCATVQKVTDAPWQKETEEIYAGYAIYHQSRGAEQSVYAAGSGVAQPRSYRLLQHLFAACELPATGRMIDVGCGNGGLLRSLANLAPAWRLNGIELSDQHREDIEAIPGVESFHAGVFAGVCGPFDLITMVHLLEHVPDPVAFLQNAAEKLATGGLLLIQVPDWTSNPFDLLIADHCTHFTPNTLRAVVEAAGFVVLEQSNEWVPKELSIVARRVHQGEARPALPCRDDAEPSIARVNTAVDWLTTLVAQARILAARGPFGVFGTSIAGTWVGQALGNAVSFFVDEDPTRVGASHLGRPVLSPNDVPSDSTVLIALAPVVAEAVFKRLDTAGRYVLPPTM